MAADWTTNYPTSQDSPTTEQPTVTDETTEGAGDGDAVKASIANTLRDKLDDVAKKLGDDSDLPSGSLAERVTTLEVGGGGGGGPLSPDSHPDTPTASDDEFEAASLDVKWSWESRGAPSTDAGIEGLDRGALNCVSFPAPTTGEANFASNVNAVTQTAPVGAWEFRCKVACIPTGSGNSGNRVGFVCRGADYNNVMYACIGQNTVNTTGVLSLRIRDGGTWHAEQIVNWEGNPAFNPFLIHTTAWFKIQYDPLFSVADRFKIYVSQNGWTYSRIAWNIPSATWTPSAIGIMGWVYGSSAGTNGFPWMCDWIRKSG